MGASPQEWLTPVSVHTWTKWCDVYAGCRLFNLSAVPASTGWPAANRALIIPFTLPWDYPVKRVFWANGATVSGTAAFGVYSPGGSQFFATASTSKAGSASTLQFVTADVILPKGPCYFVLVMSGTTTACMGSTSVTAAMGRALGSKQQDVGSTTLPAALTKAQQASALLPLFGVTRLAA